MKTVEVDLDVFKGLTNLLETAEDTYSDVIRRLIRSKGAIGHEPPVGLIAGLARRTASSSDHPVGLLSSAMTPVPRKAPEAGLLNQPADVPRGLGLLARGLQGDAGSARHASNSHKVGLADTRIDLPQGTEIQARYKGKVYVANVIDERTVELNGKKYSSLSGAAMAIAAGPVSGYAFWRIFDGENQKWIKLSEHRDQSRRQ